MAWYVTNANKMIIIQRCLFEEGDINF